ncbi:Ca(2+)-dependent cysteine protease [Entomophthora muscae]|uniref:Ca(2+)-dependent cysteine protease n=1 Tax=Entomophthora muscae TaxID=34485 RepID=A0ACC2RES0_9FUNG|nr:Ca(2+)-dependent cysteine protease [Entomophthora muscae]
MNNSVSSARQDPYTESMMDPPGSSFNEKALSKPLSSFSRKRAVLVGINYFGTREQLHGCINDTKAIQDLLCDHYGFSIHNMKILTDNQSHNPLYMPTRKNMIQAMQWLVSDASPNDSLFFYFSGHGGQNLDFKGDEDDGWDETICPVDHARAGAIIDDEINKILVCPLPPGCRLTAILDCCHSGTVLDLPYQYNSNGESLSTPVITTYYPKQGILQKWLSFFCPAEAPNPEESKIQTHTDVIVISG